ncbi:hypothetical protein A2899_04760 [Candidatus Amesbacteria bacterium RIFCSPLOWO2_01_FULL_49_25]|uniref:Uncharacterized protein n=1 Tax=Candidatus Amesbacteria bacterium RIFCSPHIGHO2_01_FULL_48_32b TaxID=1797253 RepID=A0A1F4YDK5_9BACT|nr:MAG: hypothetical protein A2876_01740 [Candidatus Amesbacteria bacterium RIFCSPHIGHO2_01_FULL_48_32b]OGD07286.1 MAG: hypothetical protein A2899_04760 [Candidatus Amesbacteria bacterium RIFCSPLOWO2_01_FULL_49_25]
MRKEDFFDGRWAVREMEAFSALYPGGNLWVAGYKYLPSKTREIFEGLSRRFVHPRSYRRNDFFGCFGLSHENGDITWGAWRRPIWRGDSSGDGIETALYFHDVSGQGDQVGRSEVVYTLGNSESFFEDKPYVEYSETAERIQGRGLDLRRLVYMNAACNFFLGRRLYSSDIFLTHPVSGERVHKRSWERLVLEGLAERLDEGEHERYVFLEPRMIQWRVGTFLERLKGRRSAG